MKRGTVCLIGFGFASMIALNLVTLGILLGRIELQPAHSEGTGMRAESLLAVTGSLQDGSNIMYLTNGQTLVLYKTNQSGQLMLTAARDITTDFDLKDNHFPNGQVRRGQKTLPAVKDIAAALKKSKKGR